jgi:hypothetical protein
LRPPLLITGWLWWFGYLPVRVDAVVVRDFNVYLPINSLHI